MIPRMVGGDVLGIMGATSVKQEPMDEVEMDSDTCSGFQDNTPAMECNVLGDTIWPQDDCGDTGLFRPSFVEQFEPPSSERGASDAEDTDIGLIDSSEPHWDEFWKL